MRPLGLSPPAGAVAAGAPGLCEVGGAARGLPAGSASILRSLCKEVRLRAPAPRLQARSHYYASAGSGAGRGAVRQSLPS